MQKHTLPLGGIGAGFLLLDEEGRLHNHIPDTPSYGTWMRNTYPAIRLQTQSGKTYVRMLRGDRHDLDAPPVPGQPDSLEHRDYRTHLQYPVASFNLRDSKAPASITWTYFSPVIPYDHVAATLPVMVVGVRVENTLNEPLKAAVMFCADNLVASGPEGLAQDQALGHVVRIMSVEDANNSFAKDESRGMLKGLEPAMLQSHGFNGLVFGERRRNEGVELGPHACLTAKKQADTRIFVSSYDPGADRSSKNFWGHFCKANKAPFRNVTARTPVGAVLLTSILAPGASQRFEFIYAWHVPDCLSEKRSVSNAYSHTFKSAQLTVHHTAKHLSYMFSAVTKWQKRLLEPQLPADFGALIIDSSRAFSTHVQHTPEGGFRFCESPVAPGDAPRFWDFFAAMALLVFAPHFHTVAVSNQLNSTWALMKSKRYEDSPEALCETAEAILSAYADVLFLGHRARMAEWLPTMHAVTENVLQRTRIEQASSTVLLNRYSLRGLGLWAAALNAMAKMAREKGEVGAAAEYQKISANFTVRYDVELLEAFQFPNKVDLLGRPPAGQTYVEKELLLLAGPCCSKLLDLDSSPAQRKILAVLAARFDSTPSIEMKGPESFHCQVVKTLMQLLHRTEGALPSSAIEALLTQVEARYRKVVDEGDAQAAFPNWRMLSLWPLLQGLIGFYYDALHQIIVFRPTIKPKDVLHLPIFSPMSLGSVTIKEEGESERALVIRLSLQTPLTIRSVVLHIPATLAQMSVSCVRDSENIAVTQEIIAEEHITRVLMTFKTPLKLTSSFTLRLREMPDAQKQQPQ